MIKQRTKILDKLKRFVLSNYNKMKTIITNEKFNNVTNILTLSLIQQKYLPLHTGMTAMTPNNGDRTTAICEKCSQQYRKFKHKNQSHH